MLIVAIESFRDKTTGETIEKQISVQPGTLLECSEELAEERIIKGLALKVVNPELLKAKETKPKTKKSK